jgi:hypothetical protein
MGNYHFVGRLNMMMNDKKFLFSVDSETGTYWHGKRALRTPEQINSVIHKVNYNPAKSRKYQHRGQTFFQFIAMNFFRAMGNSLGTRIFRFM